MWGRNNSLQSNVIHRFLVKLTRIRSKKRVLPQLRFPFAKEFSPLLPSLALHPARARDRGESIVLAWKSSPKSSKLFSNRDTFEHQIRSVRQILFLSGRCFPLFLLHWRGFPFIPFQTSRDSNRSVYTAWHSSHCGQFFCDRRK